MNKDLEFKVFAQFGRTDGSPEDYLDFSASVYDPVEDVYVDSLDGVIWLTGAGIDIAAKERGVVPVSQSVGVRWVEHTLMVAQPIVGAQVMARMKIPSLPREMSMVATTVGDVSGTSGVQLTSEDVSVVLYRKEQQNNGMA